MICDLGETYGEQVVPAPQRVLYSYIAKAHSDIPTSRHRDKGVMTAGQYHDATR